VLLVVWRPPLSSSVSDRIKASQRGLDLWQHSLDPALFLGEIIASKQATPPSTFTDGFSAGT
jgi:hypothetical protein